MEQKYTSKNTSVNTIPRVFKKCEFKKGSLVLDYGGGKYESAKAYIEREAGVKLFIYDPYNRTHEHNTSVLNMVNDAKGFDYVTCNNVLNVLYEDSEIDYVLRVLQRLCKKEGSIYIQIYEGDRSGIGKETTKGYQRHLKTSEYDSIIRNVYNDNYEVIRKDGIFRIKLK